MARPDWTKPESYPKTPEAWPFRVWAWEFLRRNPEFQRQCDELAEASAGAKQRMARSWGLGEFKPYKEGYFSPSGCLWLSEAFREYEAAEDSDKEYRVLLKQHEVALVFDLNNVTTAGLSAIEAQLGAAREVLLDYMREFGLKPADVRVNRRGLFEALRVYDAIVHGGARITDVAKELEPAAFPPDTTKALLDRQNYLRKKVNDDLKRGKSLIEERGYLKLVSRDYIEDRSEVRKKPRG